MRLKNNKGGGLVKKIMEISKVNSTKKTKIKNKLIDFNLSLKIIFDFKSYH